MTVSRFVMTALLGLCVLPHSATFVQADPPPEIKTTVLGTRFAVRAEFEKPIDELVSSLRAKLLAQRSKGMLICYLSIPLSATGGGYRPVNGEVAEDVKRRLEETFGADKFFVLAPGLAETALSAVGEVQPGGGDYMYMWTKVLAGDDGLGADFDMVYFAGPADFHRYFKVKPPGLIAGLESWMGARAESDATFKAAIIDVPAARRGFIGYYATKASVAFSNGAHDEWNIFVQVNKNRARPPQQGLSAQIPCYFDGRPLTPLEMEREVAPGYEMVPLSLTREHPAANRDESRREFPGPVTR